MTLSPLSPLQRKIIGIVAIALLILAFIGIGYVAAKGDRQKKEETRLEQTVQRAEKTDEKTITQEEMASVVSQLNTALSTMEQRVKAAETRTNDLSQNVQREIIRIPSAPAPSSDGKPIVINVPQSAPAAPGAPIVLPADTPQGVPVEIVREIIMSQDRSRTESSSETETKKTDEMTAKVDEKVDTMKSTEAEKKTEKTETEKTVVVSKKEEEPAGSGEESAPRLGVGAGMSQAGSAGLFISYDLVNKQLVPVRVLGLNKIRVGLGGFVTTDGGDLMTLKKLDGGPQGNISKGNTFLMLGYKVKARTPFLGVGFKF